MYAACPPDRSGRLPEATVDTLAVFGGLLKSRLGADLALKARVYADSERKPGRRRDYKAGNMTDGDAGTYWATDDGVKSAVVTLVWKRNCKVRYVELMEYIPKGQRVKKFRVEVSADGKTWERVASDVETTTIGYKRIIPLNGSTTDSYGEGYDVRKLRIVIEDSKACPLISKISVY